MSDVTAVPAAAEAYCPHCLLGLGIPAGAAPSTPQRCPHCRLVIGAGRARERPDGGRAHATAAGVLANAARRSESEPLDPAVIYEGLARVSAENACQLERLRMLDYQEMAERDATLPSLGEVLATSGSWKQARRDAAAALAPQSEVG